MGKNKKILLIFFCNKKIFFSTKTKLSRTLLNGKYCCKKIQICFWMIYGWDNVEKKWKSELWTGFDENSRNWPAKDRSDPYFAKIVNFCNDTKHELSKISIPHPFQSSCHFIISWLHCLTNSRRLRPGPSRLRRFPILSLFLYIKNSLWTVWGCLILKTQHCYSYLWAQSAHENIFTCPFSASYLIAAVHVSWKGFVPRDMVFLLVQIHFWNGRCFVWPHPKDTPLLIPNGHMVSFFPKYPNSLVRTVFLMEIKFISLFFFSLLLKASAILLILLLTCTYHKKYTLRPFLLIELVQKYVQLTAVL